MLKRIATKRLPPELINRPKRGFSTPTRRWFDPEMIGQQIRNDMNNGDWWRKIFQPAAADAVTRLRGNRS